MSTATTLPAPAAAAKFAADARALGYTVTESATQASYEVYVTRTFGGRTYDTTAVWSVMNVAANNSRLGFKTDYKRGVRLDYVTACGWTPTGSYGHWCPTSVRGARFALGMPI